MLENNFNQNEIMQRVAFFRNKRKMSASALSKSLGHERNYIYRLEKGEIKLDLPTLQEILDILQVSCSEFFYIYYLDYENDMKVIETVREFKPKERESLISFLSLVSRR